MGKVEAIEQAVQGLPPVDLAKFRSWFAEYDANAWDAQIAASPDSGVGHHCGWRGMRRHHEA